MAHTKNYSDHQINSLIHEIIHQIIKDKWSPDYVVGLTPGGLIPAIKISKYLGIPMETLKINLKDDGQAEINCWMADDAYDGKHILVINDINADGTTLEWLKKDWESSSYPGDHKWDGIWNETVRFAVLVDNDASPTQVNYIGESINKTEDNHWIVFPWEEWWKE